MKLFTRQPQPSPEMKERVTAVERIVGYDFVDKTLLEEALTHPSSCRPKSYQRLEHLGDSVLNHAVTKYLFRDSRKFNEEEITNRRKDTVRNPNLARIGARLGLYDYLLRYNTPDLDDQVAKFTEGVIKGKDMSGSPGYKVLADVVESVAAAVYVDLNYDLDKLWKIFKPLLDLEKSDCMMKTRESDSMLGYIASLLYTLGAKAYKVERVLTLVSASGPTLPFSCMFSLAVMDTDTLTPAVEAAFDRLDASMEASFDRLDALMAQILSRFQERINALDRKISLGLTTRSLCPPVLDRGDSFLPGDDISVGLFVSDRKISWPSTIDAALSDGPQFQACKLGLDVVTHTPSVALLVEMSQAGSESVSKKGESSLLCEVGLAGIPSFLQKPTFALAATKDDPSVAPKFQTFPVGLARTPQSAIGMSCFWAMHKMQFWEGFVPIIAHTLVSSYQSSSKIAEIKIPARYWVQESGASPALPLFVEMPTSAGICNGCPGVLDFQLDYLMGIRDKGGGFIGCIWRQELRRVRSMLTLIFSFSCMNASASAQEWRLLCFHVGYADDFEFGYHMGIRDKGGGLLGWLWWQEVRRFSHNPFRLIGVGLSVWTFATAACGSSIDFWTITICRMLVLDHCKISQLSCFLCMHASGSDQAIVDVASFVCDLIVSFKINHAKILHIWLPKLPSSHKDTKVGFSSADTKREGLPRNNYLSQKSQLHLDSRPHQVASMFRFSSPDQPSSSSCQYI